MRVCFYREMTQHCRRVGLHWLGWVAPGSAQCRPGGTNRLHGGDTWALGRPAGLRFLLLGFQLSPSIPFHPRDPLLPWLFTSTSPGRPAPPNTTNPTPSSIFSGMFSIASSPAPSTRRSKAMRELGKTVGCDGSTWSGQPRDASACHLSSSSTLTMATGAAPIPFAARGLFVLPVM